VVRWNPAQDLRGVVMYRFTLNENEKILKKGEAILHVKDESFTGALYLTNERLVFVGFVLGAFHQHERSVSLMQIKELTAGKTFFIIPNVLNVTSDADEHLKIVIQERDEWLAAIRNHMAAAANAR
jgi:hypothetical protein